MDTKAIHKAKIRLRTTKRSLSALGIAKSHDEFCDHWYVFITAWKSIYTALEEGAKACPKSRQWFGSKQTERRNDALLQYLFQARNDEEHGLDTATKLDPGYIAIGVIKPDSNRHMSGRGLRIKDNSITIDRVTSLDGKPIYNEVRAPHPILIPVKDRGGNIYNPPISHLGKMLTDQEPLTVAHCALSYITALVSEADTLS